MSRTATASSPTASGPPCSSRRSPTDLEGDDARLGRWPASACWITTVSDGLDSAADYVVGLDVAFPDVAAVGRAGVTRDERHRRRAGHRRSRAAPEPPADAAPDARVGPHLAHRRCRPVSMPRDHFGARSWSTTCTSSPQRTPEVTRCRRFRDATVGRHAASRGRPRSSRRFELSAGPRDPRRPLRRRARRDAVADEPVRDRERPGVQAGGPGDLRRASRPVRGAGRGVRPAPRRHLDPDHADRRGRQQGPDAVDAFVSEDRAATRFYLTSASDPYSQRRLRHRPLRTGRRQRRGPVLRRRLPPRSSAARPRSSPTSITPSQRLRARSASSR